jgi:hypothetical protein
MPTTTLPALDGLVQWLRNMDDPAAPDPQLQRWASAVESLEAALAVPAQWMPIETAPLGKMVLLWHRGWRHCFAGQRVGDNGAVVVDTCEPEARGADYFASHWKPLDAPAPPGAAAPEGKTE